MGRLLEKDDLENLARQTIEWWRLQAEEAIERVKDRAAIHVAWALPRRVAKWAYVRVVSEASTTELSNQEMPSITVIDALRGWEKRS